MTTIELKHGDFKVNLLVCNKALRLASITFLEETGQNIMTSLQGNPMAFAEFLMMYAYHSYCIYCRENKIEVELSSLAFEEKMSNKGVLAKDSTAESVFSQLAESLVTSIKSQLPQVEEKKSQSTGMKKKVISVEN